ncbi:MAG: UvrB/UvrC motif-containing protein [Planctomycetota bacterium]
MNLDLTEMLEDWPYEPGKINVRLIQSQEGEPLIQVRLDLGLLQMKVEGRPDGQRPRGYSSLLEYYEARLDGIEPPPEPVAEEQPEETDGAEGDSEGVPDSPEPIDAAPGAEGEDGFSLSPDDCRQLREEAVQYYHRYIALLVLEDYDGVVRDTSRNLRVLDICKKHASEEDDQAVLEQFRPYITMMRSRALASQALKDEEPKVALLAVDEGLAALKAHFEDIGEPEAMEQSSEARALMSMREALVPKLPVSQGTELRQRLSDALATENYELAAILRDELRLLGETTTGTERGPGPPPQGPQA